ncbi:type 1 glutamine amidotransferase [Longispora albida]|uniref:type 1 glutamine amidotransferase n=1 Tax=Longispora albida TaxID=203523 RepID=UPI00068814A9|nr:type 1 glutamine amidotransferase [Longispora albida]
MTRALVIENDPKAGIERLGDWLAGGGLELEILRPHAGDQLPEDLSGYVAFVVLGGAQDAFGAPDGTPGAPWFPQVERLLRKAVKDRVATLGVCLGAQLLAQAMGGTVGRAKNGPNIGARFVARRDAAERDPLWAAVPLGPDAIQWHFDEVTELPLNATLLAASPRWPHQAFRVGDRAWGIQFHIECGLETIATWARNDAGTLAELGTDPETVIAECAAVMGEVEETWKPFAERFAALATGRTPGPLTLIDLPPR